MNKYKTYIKSILVFISLISILTSCSEKQVDDLLTGQLIGHVKLFDANMDYIKDNSGVKVSVEGSKPLIEVVTNEDGKYIIDNLKSGTYNLIYSKDGFCLHKVIGHMFVGGDKPSGLSQISLYENTKIHIDSLSLRSLDYYQNPIIISVSAFVSDKIDGDANARYFIGNTPDVSYTNYLETGIFRLVNPEYYSVIEIDTFNYPEGSKVFMKFYPLAYPYYGMSYQDINTGLEIFSCVNSDNSSNILEITVPEIPARYN